MKFGCQVIMWKFPFGRYVINKIRKIHLEMFLGWEWRLCCVYVAASGPELEEGTRTVDFFPELHRGPNGENFSEYSFRKLGE